MSGPLVSILTPVYNGECFLNAAVNSVCNQSYANWELLLVDDGSQDGSWRLIQEWAERDERIKAFAHPGHVNRGVSASRNLALQHASGKYVALLDCDDEWLPAKLERQVRILEDNPDVVIVYSKAISIDSAGIELRLTPGRHDFPLLCGSGFPGKSGNVVDGMIKDAVWMPTLTVVMVADAVNTLGGFDETLAFQVEDHLLFTLLSERGKVWFVDEILARYRVHSSSYTQTTQWLYSMIEYYECLYGKLSNSYNKRISVAKGHFIVKRLVGEIGFKSNNKIVLKNIIISHIFDSHISLLGKFNFMLAAMHKVILSILKRIFLSIKTGGKCENLAACAILPITPGEFDLNMLPKLLAREDPVILEIGCNNGSHTLEFLRLFNKARIYAFEPDPRALAAFRSRINDGRVKLHDMAISDKDGETEFHLSDGLPSPEWKAIRPLGWDLSGSIKQPKEHLIVNPWCTFAHAITVKTKKLDTWCREEGVAAIDFIWADVQGAEEDLIKGGLETLRKTRYFYTEYNDRELYKGQIPFVEIQRLLPDFDVLFKFANDALFVNKAFNN